MPVRTVVDKERDITVHTATGDLSDEEMFAAQREFYENGPTTLQLWEMSECSVKEVTIGGMRTFIERAAQLGKARKNGRTAVIVSSQLQYGLARMAESFGDTGEAKAWLNRETEGGT